MEQTVQNIRFAIRTLRKNRTFALFAILTLGLGIGANTAIFSVIDGVLLKPLPYTSGERLLLVRQSAPLAGRPNTSVSIKELYDYREQTASFDALVEHHQMSFDLLKQGEPDRVSTGVVSHDFFNVLGISPIAGRTFEGDDHPGAEAVLVLSHSYWLKAFGGDPSVVGRVFQMNDRPHTVIGILPAVPLYPQEHDVYMSVSACPFRAASERRIAQNRRAFAALTVFGRLKPGVSREQATSDVRAVSQRFTEANRGVYAAASGFTATTLPVRDELTRQARPLLLILLGTTGFVLLIACSNVANLSLARLLRRERELAVRAALGAGRAQLIRQLLTESVLLSLAGGVVGILFASSTLSMLTTFIARFTSRTRQKIEIDPRVLLFTIGVSILTGIIFGILPALSSRADLVTALKQGSKGAGDSPGRRRIQSGLIVLQVAVSVVLLIGAGLLLTSLYRLQQVDPGYRADRVISAEAFPNFTKYARAETQVQFYETAMRRIEALPGVVGVAVTNAVPLSAIAPGASPVLIKGETDAAAERSPTANVNVASPGYFSTLGIPLDGRDFSTADKSDGAPVVIVNRTMTRYWKQGSPVGAQVSLDNGRTWATVIGVSGDVRQYSSLSLASLPQIFVPLTQSGGLAGRFVVRTEVDPLTMAQALRTEIHAVDPDMPIKNVTTLAELRSRSLATPKLTALLLTVFAALALVVTIAGISGVIAISVTHRLEEFGVRMALGASRPQILKQVIGQGLRLVAIGLVVGIGLSFAATKVLSAYLYATKPTDPATLALVSVAFLGAGVISCLGPAWRATSADPLKALRAD